MDVRLQGLTLAEALEILEGDCSDTVQNIFLEPQEGANGPLTDEDSGDEDGGGTIDNLSGRQLRSRVDVAVRREVSDDGDNADDSSSGDDDDDARPQPATKRTKRMTYQWTKQDLPCTHKVFPENDFSALRDATPVDIFELYFDDDLCQFLADQSNKYATFKNCPCPNITKDEIRVFISILILSGYNKAPNKRAYWEDAGDVHNTMVSNAMRRNRFLEICRFIHCADNLNIDEHDRMFKVRPLVSRLKKAFREQYRPEMNMCFDESMIPYYGPHPCKQSIRGKPIRFGYKAWCLNSSSGYLIDFEFYQGKNHRGNPEYESRYGKCAAPMVNMLDDLPEPVKDLPFELYFDNLFTGMNLLDDLQSRGYGATGTIRENRVPKDCPIMSVTDMKKKSERGDCDYQKSSNGILIARWKDNSVVTIASNVHGMNPFAPALRYSSIQKKKIRVSRPKAFTEYNKYMGGTDKMDHGLSLYRIAIRNKKWYWSLFMWLIEVSLHNAWTLARNAGNKITQVDFRRSVVQVYLLKYMCTPAVPRRRNISVSSRVADTVRYDGRNHLVCFYEGKKRGRCDGNSCNSYCRTKCLKCNVGLCVTCFVDYHVPAV